MSFLRFSILSLAFAFFLVPTVLAQDYERIDVNDQGQLGDGGGGLADISHDGRFVVFTSTATTISGPDAVGTPDIFVRDRQLHTTTRITSSLNPSDPMQYGAPHISGDGTTISFMLGGLVAGTSSRRSFTHRLGTAVTTEVLVPNLINITVFALSADGRFAAVNAGENAALQVYRLDLTSGAVILCSRDLSGSPAGGRVPDIDDDGSHVVFESASPNLVLGDTNGKFDVFVHDIPNDIVTQASVSTNGVGGNGMTYAATITGDGRYVAMNSTATNFVTLTVPPGLWVFVRDLQLGTTSLVSVNEQGSPMSATIDHAYISADGTGVAFPSFQPVDSSDTASQDVYLRDMAAGATLPSSPGDPSSALYSLPMAVTADGREVLFICYQQTLLGTSQGPGVYVASFGPRCSTENYCTSLPNSTGAAATIGAQGDASRTLNNLVIAGVGLPDQAIAMLVSGTGAIDPGTPFGNGLLCVGGALIRHGIHVADGGVILDYQDVNSAEFAAVHPGDTRFYQIFYRDPPAGGALFNTTDAVSVTFCW